MFPDDSIKLATDCVHRDKKMFAKGLCSVCYHAQRKAEKHAQTLINSNDKTIETRVVELTLEWDKDPALKSEFGKIMWGWIRGGESSPIWKDVDGKKVRDYQLELRRDEMAQKKADKAATVLGRAYVVEKVEEVKPQPLPIGGSVDMSGWGQAEEAESAELEEEILESQEDEDTKNGEK